jgi:preprotein translocase subunit SecF
MNNWLHRINWMKDAKYWIIVSVILTVIGMGAFAFKGLNTGIDFTGGMTFDIRFTGNVEQAKVASAVEGVVGTNASVQQTADVKGGNPGDTEYFIKTPELTNDKRDQLFKAFEGLAKYEKVGEDEVSGVVSKELTQQAVLAVIIAAVLQIVYLWFRFELKFGVTAVIALLHDVAITMGVLSITRIQINSAFVAAILTILGYSINDTVIVFDRIRENLKKRKKGETLTELTTRSISEVITRSVYTVLTVEFTLIALVLFGGDSIKDFVATLLIGITSGMYSSIFIAAALWVYWQEWDDRRHKEMAKAKVGKKPVKA